MSVGIVEDVGIISRKFGAAGVYIFGRSSLILFSGAVWGHASAPLMLQPRPWAVAGAMSA